MVALVGMLTLARRAEPAPWVVYADFNYADGIELYRIRYDGQGLQRLTHDPPNQWIMERLPRWSPNGLWIAYAANDVNSYRIFRLRLRDQYVEQVTQGDGYIHALTWSSDGQSLIYEVNFFGERSHLQIPVRGGDPQPFTGTTTSTILQTHSPDGEWIVFTRYLPRRTLGLYRARPDKSDELLLNHRLAADTAFGWSPLVDLPWHGWKTGLLVLFVLAGGWLVLEKLRRAGVY